MVEGDDMFFRAIWSIISVVVFVWMLFQLFFALGANDYTRAIFWSIWLLSIGGPYYAYGGYTVIVNRKNGGNGNGKQSYNGDEE